MGGRKWLVYYYPATSERVSDFLRREGRGADRKSATHFAGSTMAAKNTRSRAWVFTINNPTDGDRDAVRRLVETNPEYLIASNEIGEKGTPHIQGYVRWLTQRAFSTITKKLARARVSAAKGTPKQNQDYCKKDGDVLVEHGEAKDQGERTDLEAVIDAVKEGTTEADLHLQHTAVCAKYPRFVENVRRIFAPKRDVTKPPQVVCYWGPAGAGKTRAAFEAMPEAFMKTPSTGEWWTGYDGHQDVIIDEADKGYLKLADMLSILDRYPVMVRVHGSVRHFVPTRIILTANKPPQDWYPNCSVAERQGLLRRIGEVRHFPGQIIVDPIDYGLENPVVHDAQPDCGASSIQEAEDAGSDAPSASRAGSTSQEDVQQDGQARQDDDAVPASCRQEEQQCSQPERVDVRQVHRSQVEYSSRVYRRVCTQGDDGNPPSVRGKDGY